VEQAHRKHGDSLAPNLRRLGVETACAAGRAYLWTSAVEVPAKRWSGKAQFTISHRTDCKPPKCKLRLYIYL
jgi:hypothetical protein